MVNKNLNEINAVIDSGQKITAFGGFWWLKKFMERLGIGAVFAQDYGIKQRRRGFSERDYFLSVLYSLLSGGKAISDIEKIRGDKAFKRLSGLTRGIPTAGAVLRFFNSSRGASVERFLDFNAAFAERLLHLMRINMLRFGKVVYAFMDSSEIEVYGEQFEGAGKNYEGNLALRLHAVFLEDFLCGLELHEVSHFVTFGWEHLLKRLSKAARAIRSKAHILLDSAYFDHRIINAIIAGRHYYSITCKHYPSLEDEARSLEPEQWKGDYAEFAYKPIGIAEPQRVAVRRFKKYCPDLFSEYNYAFVMTNRGGLTAQEIFDIHSAKSGYENNFKGLLSGLGLHHPRFMKLNANRLFCQVAMLAYNIMQAAKYLVLNGTKYFFTSVSGFIYRFVTNAGRLVTHNFKATLKLTEYPLDIGFIEGRVANIRTG
jgi:hypothetical protein